MPDFSGSTHHSGRCRRRSQGRAQRRPGTLLVGVVVPLLLAACASRPVGYSDFDLKTDFSGFRSFSFVPERTLVGAQPTRGTTVFAGNDRETLIVGRGIGTEVHNQSGLQGSLVIDFYDPATRQKKWMGWTVDELRMADRTHLERTVRALVPVILDQFPPEL